MSLAEIAGQASRWAWRAPAPWMTAIGRGEIGVAAAAGLVRDFFRGPVRCPRRMICSAAEPFPYVVHGAK